jgi:hypothetical protein
MTTPRLPPDATRPASATLCAPERCRHAVRAALRHDGVGVLQPQEHHTTVIVIGCTEDPPPYIWESPRWSRRRRVCQCRQRGPSPLAIHPTPSRPDPLEEQHT